MAHKIQVKGPIVPNDYAWYYKYFDEDCCCVNMVQQILNEANGEDVEVYVNSPGGVIDVGSEIYTLLRAYEGNVTIYIVGEACSAASIISMAGTCYMAPTALMMVHCVSSSCSGNHNDMEKMSEVLTTADNALCTAYMNKSGMSREDAIAMMEATTWMTAEQAKDKGLIDGIMFEEDNQSQMQLTASNGFSLPGKDLLGKVKKMIEEQQASREDEQAAFLMQQKQARAKLNLLKLKGAILND